MPFDECALFRDKLLSYEVGIVNSLKAVLSSFDVTPAEGACDVAAPKRRGLNAKMALYTESMLVTVPSPSCPEALLSPIARLVRRVLEFTNENFVF